MDAQSFVATQHAVTLEDRELFVSYVSRFPQRVCEMSFTNMFLWGRSRNHRICEFEGHLVMSFQKRDGPLSFYPPIGPEPARIMSDVLTPGRGFDYLYVDEEIAKNIPESPFLQETRNNADYVYRIKDLVDLVGTPYVSHRNKIKRAEALTPEILSLDASHKEECLQLQHAWLARQKDPTRPSLLDEIDALTLAFENFAQLGLFGVGIRIKGVLESFAIGVELHSTMALEHFEKASTNYTGLYQLVLHEFVKRCPAHFELLNREEDMGEGNLRAVKEGWNPAFLVNKFSYSKGD